MGSILPSDLVLVLGSGAASTTPFRLKVKASTWCGSTFAEPYWGAPGGPEGEEGRRVFSVTGEGEALLEDFDVYAEVGAVTALVKQVEVEVTDGELNLRFTASEGEPIVAAIEVLQPSQ